MDRAFGELEEAFFRSGAVISVGSCTSDSKRPSRPPLRPLPPQPPRPLIEGSGGHVLPGAEFHETVQLGLKHTVELGGYYTAYVIDGPGDADDYEELTIDVAG